jgi:hypothetical protein
MLDLRAHHVHKQCQIESQAAKMLAQVAGAESKVSVIVLVRPMFNAEKIVLGIRSA